MRIEALYNRLVEDFAVADWEDATGLVLDFRDPHSGFVQIIGPFPKDTVDILTHIERLQSEEDPDSPGPSEYIVRLLFKPDEIRV